MNNNFMKKKHFVRLVFIAFLAITSVVVIKVRSMQKPIEEQSAAYEPVLGKKKAPGEFIVLESFRRYIKASYH
jgi:hypothetical protein